MWYIKITLIPDFLTHKHINQFYRIPVSKNIFLKIPKILMNFYIPKAKANTYQIKIQEKLAHLYFQLLAGLLF